MLCSRSLVFTLCLPLALSSVACKKKRDVFADTGAISIDPPQPSRGLRLGLRASTANMQGTGDVDEAGTLSMLLSGPDGAVAVVDGHSVTLSGGKGSLEVSLSQVIARAPARHIATHEDGHRPLVVDGPRNVPLGSLPLSVTRPGLAAATDSLSVMASEPTIDSLGRQALFAVKSGKTIPKGNHPSAMLLWFDGDSPRLSLHRVGAAADGDTIGDIERVAFTTWSEPRPLGVCSFSGVGGPGASLTFETVDAHLAIYDTHTGKLVKETTIPSPRKCPSGWSATRDQKTARLGPSPDALKAWVEQQARAK